MNKFNGLKVGFVITGSFCTFSKALEQMQVLKDLGAEIVPVMSERSSSIDTRFGKASEHIEKIKQISGKDIIFTIDAAEPIGPKNYTDILLVAPCTGNTLAKLAYSITDSSATMAVKSHLRNSRPVVINLATNDALSGSFKNIGYLMNTRNYYFVPFSQDDSTKKPTSLISDFKLIPETLLSALKGKQLQPVVV